MPRGGVTGPEERLIIRLAQTGRAQRGRRAVSTARSINETRKTANGTRDTGRKRHKKSSALMRESGCTDYTVERFCLLLNQLFKGL